MMEMQEAENGGLAVLQKQDLLTRGSLSFYGELNVDRDPELGADWLHQLYVPIERTHGT